MEIKRGIIGIAWLLSLFGVACQAADLCHQDCEFGISFPSGGSIEALEALTITFGEGGLIDTGGAVTAYLDGETLRLNASESLVFGNGGSFDIGAAGNIDFTDMTITTEGSISLGASGGNAQIQILAGSRLSFLGASRIDIDSPIVNHDTLVIGPAASLHLSGPGTPAGCDLSSSSGATLSVNGASPVILDPGASCADTYATLGSDAILTSGSLNITDGSSNLVLGSLTPVNVGNPTLTANPSNDDETAAAGIDWFFILLLATFWTGKQLNHLRIEARPIQHDLTQARYPRSG